jgi:hypothetical protein
MNPVEELSQLANAAAEARTRLREKAIQEPLFARRRSCDNVARAWSGSNIGYHATVYYEGLRPKPPAVQFSAEWGLEDVWPAHQPDPHWQIMDRQTVIDEIVSHAGNPDVEALGTELAPIRKVFADLKENTISVLSAVLSKTPDSFLQKNWKTL